jgi:ABC-type phosphate/phosphonate transport system permease subunit
MVGMEYDFELPKNMRSNILLNIQSEEKRIAKQQLLGSLIVAVLSIGAIVASVNHALVAFYQSSFYSYMSLLLSDPDIVTQYWREFVLALLESIPVIGMILCLGALAAFLFSLKLFAQSQRFVFTPSLVN